MKRSSERLQLQGNDDARVPCCGPHPVGMIAVLVQDRSCLPRLSGRVAPRRGGRRGSLSPVLVAPLSAHRWSRPAAACELGLALRAARAWATASLGADLERRRRHQFGDVGGQERVGAASSLNPKSMSHTAPSSARKMLASRRSRWAMRCRRSCRPAPRWRPGRRRSRPREATRSRDRPATAS